MNALQGENVSTNLRNPCPIMFLCVFVCVLGNEKNIFLTEVHNQNSFINHVLEHQPEKASCLQNPLMKLQICDLT